MRGGCQEQGAAKKLYIFLHILLDVLCIFLYISTNKENVMKRKDILKKLANAGFTFEEGANHTKAYDAQGMYRAAIGRHTEINERIVKKIERQTGVKIR